MEIKTWDITGFGGGYEETCQTMLWNAVRFVSEKDCLGRNIDREVKSEQSPQIYGIAINKGKYGKEFDKAMMKGIEDATGAMHHCATNHALYIQKHGYKKWFEEIKKHRKDEQFYVFNYPHKFELVTK